MAGTKISRFATADVIAIPYLYFSSLYHNISQRGLFDDVKTFVLFMGCPRSGHTLVGFLLDAHPNIIVGSRVSTLKYHKHGFGRQQIFDLLLQNSRQIASLGRQRKYSYEVPGQWQGRFESLKVIGDSTGLTRLRDQPELLGSLQRKLRGIEIRLIHCVRNPYDNISTMKARRGWTLPDTIEEYFSMCERIEELKKQVGGSAVHELRHEGLIADPPATLRRLCGFLGVPARESYHAACAGIIYRSAHKSRLEVPWDPQVIDAVKHRMDRFSFLRGYSYDDETRRQDSSGERTRVPQTGNG